MFKEKRVINPPEGLAGIAIKCPNCGHVSMTFDETIHSESGWEHKFSCKYGMRHIYPKYWKTDEDGERYLFTDRTVPPKKVQPCKGRVIV